VAFVLLIQLCLPFAARGSSYEVYALRGFEIWFTPTVGTFVGVGEGTDARLSGWFTQIEHTIAISPTGLITGGTASLRRVDGVSMEGTFATGTVRQVNDGPNCTNEMHEVAGSVYGLTRSDSPGSLGAGHFTATLEHYRTWLFGRCYSYSAIVNGTFTVAF
jgi:hypothetical protein